jgi:ABC-type polysaccharide/polyol phosphate transport system ATPase subunit
MNQAAITVKEVSKKFRLFQSPRERLWEALHPFHRKYHKEFWALQNVSFEVRKGQTIGIIGRNGSGKSTLLQILSSILKPTTGEVKTCGSISTLLDLNSGFNPEFTGRQNVLMKGMLMGFSEKEMKRRLPEIEAFADIGEFIHQPVTIYSSGMSVRLAFACAIHVDPEILIIDEALAVGDAKFQHKCFGKFLEFQRAGKTIVLVTHDTGAVVKHCDFAILLEKGEILERGEPEAIVNYYIDLLFTGKLANYQTAPVLIQEGLHGFNIVHYKRNFYALQQSLGAVDLAGLPEEDLTRYVQDGSCRIASSPDEIRQYLEKDAPEANILPSKDVSDTLIQAAKQASELGLFLQEIPPNDNCSRRRNYNKNEYRQGFKKAEIIDYLVVSEKGCDPVTVFSGDAIDIYIKARFHMEVAVPWFGFSIKTIDGLPVYAWNTFFTDSFITPVKASDVVVCKFSLRMSLNSGDYFIDLGIDETKDMQVLKNQHRKSRPWPYESLDRRCSIIHLFLQETDCFDGLANLFTKFQQVASNGEIFDY